MTDNVNHPPHYKKGGIENIDVIEAYELGFHLGNVIKYVLRSKYKGREIEDLKKARWYLERYIKNHEGGSHVLNGIRELCEEDSHLLDDSTKNYLVENKDYVRESLEELAKKFYEGIDEAKEIEDLVVDLLSDGAEPDKVVQALRNAALSLEVQWNSERPTCDNA